MTAFGPAAAALTDRAAAPAWTSLGDVSEGCDGGLRLGYDLDLAQLPDRPSS